MDLLWITALATLIEYFAKPGQALSVPVLAALFGTGSLATGWILRWMAKKRAQ